MKKPIITISFFLLTICSQLFSQNIDLYAVTFGSPIHFGKIDLQNGTLAYSSAISQTQNQFTVIYSSAFNQANRQYLFLSKESASNQYNFNRVDVVTNSQLPNSTISNAERLYGLQYDLRSAKLYGLRLDSLTSQVYIARMNPNTGKIISEHPIAGVTSFGRATSSPSTTFDPQRGIYIFIGKEVPTIPRLYRVKASTGQVISNPPIIPYIHEMQYNVPGDVLYGLRLDTDSGRVELVDIDTTNASQKHVTYMSPQSIGFSSGSSCFDQKSQTYISIQNHVGQGSGYLTFYNIPKDSLYSVGISNELKELEVDNSVFGASHFGLSPLSVQPIEATNISIFPNPVIDELRIETSQIHEWIHAVWLSDMTGKTLITKENMHSKNYALNVSGLPNGMYQLTLLVGDKIVQRRISINPF